MRGRAGALPAHRGKRNRAAQARARGAQVSGPGAGSSPTFGNHANGRRKRIGVD